MLRLLRVTQKSGHTLAERSIIRPNQILYEIKQAEDDQVVELCKERDRLNVEREPVNKGVILPDRRQPHVGRYTVVDENGLEVQL